MAIETQKALFIAVLVIIVALASRKPGAEEKTVVDIDENVILLVPPTGLGGSVLVDEWARKHGIELRRYQENVDVSQAEPWVQELYPMARGHVPAAIACIAGIVTIIEIDDCLLENLDTLL